MFITDGLLQDIVAESNRRTGELFLSNHMQEKSRITEEKSLTVTTLKVVLGLWIHMGDI